MTTLTSLPPAPQRSNPSTFATLADAWVSALETTFTPQMNLIIPEINALATSADVDAATATTQANIATTQANNAATSANIATTQASLATTNGAAQVSLATTQANNAASSAANALTSEINASKLNLGNKPSPPTLDNQGAALLAGATYYDTTLSKWRVYSGSAWTDGLSAVAGVTSFNGSTGAVLGVSSVNGATGAITGVATLTGVQTLTNKTITEIVFSLTGTTPALLATNGAVQTWTLSANSTPTDSLTSGGSIILVITPGAFTITWPSVVWTKQGGSGVAPTLFSAGKTSVVLWKVGSTLYGSHLGDTA